jgi:predicted ATP-binding protein involved in virulence
MKIQSLTLENLRGFVGKHEIVLTDPQVAAFIGVNGSGKSTVLEAIATSLANLTSFMNKVDGSTDSHFDRFDVYQDRDSAVWDIQFSYLDAHEKYKFIQELFNRVGSISGPAGAYSRKEQKLIDRLRSDIVREDSLIPVFGYYRSTDLKPDIYQQKRNLSPAFQREETYHGAWKSNVDFSQIADLYSLAINIENNEKVNYNKNYESPMARSFRLGTSTFLNALHNTKDYRTIQLTRKGFQQVLAYKKDGVLLNMNQLSSGELSVVALMMDLIHRCVLANSHLDDPLTSPGVVLIDEIELHLHPRWQATIVKALTTTFPNIQFIISTHAPLVVNLLKDEQLFVLRESGVVPGSDLMTTYGMSAGDVITLIMGAPSRPPEVGDRFDRIAKLLADPSPDNLKEAQKQLAELRNTISPHDLELIQLANLLSLEESAVDL